MLNRALIASSFLLLATPAMAAETGAAHTGPVPAARADAPTYVVPGRAAPATRADRSRYAAREAASPEAKQYRGGDDVVIISSGAVVLALVIVLLIVLL